MAALGRPSTRESQGPIEASRGLITILLSLARHGRLSPGCRGQVWWRSCVSVPGTSGLYTHTHTCTPACGRSWSKREVLEGFQKEGSPRPGSAAREERGWVCRADEGLLPFSPTPPPHPAVLPPPRAQGASWGPTVPSAPAVSRRRKVDIFSFSATDNSQQATWAEAE